MITVADIQRALNARGEKLAVDGNIGPKTLAAIMRHLAPTLPDLDDARSSLFDAASEKRLAAAHPKIKEVMNAARAEIEFKVLDSQRGKAAQEKAFLTGHSKAHFGQSAHNWEPAIAVDLFPAPYDWNNRKSFVALFDVIMRIAKEKGIPLRCGLDWDMNGTNKGHDDWDGGHYELHPWRDWAKSSKPYAG